MDQQPQSIIKKPSKFSRILRAIFGSCGGKSVEKTLVEDEKDGNRDYSFSFYSSGLDSDSAYSAKEKEELQVADLKRKLTETTEEKEAEKMISDLKMEAETLNGEKEEEKEDEDEKDGNTDYSFSFSSSGLGSKSKDGEDEAPVLQIERGKQESAESLTEVEDGNVGNEEDEEEKDGNTDFSFSFSRMQECKAGLEKKRLAFAFLKLFQECKAGLEDAERKTEEMEEEELQKSTEDSLSEKNIARQRKLEEDYFDFEVLIEETSARMRGLEHELDSLRTQKGEIEKQEADELSSLLKKLEENQNSDFEFPTYADEIRPVFPIFGRDELDGVPASDASAVAESPERCKKNNKRVKPTVAGGGVTVAPGRDRRRLLMPYRQEGFFANVKMLCTNVNAFKAVIC